jgi:DNA end-binding protein Ku
MYFDRPYYLEPQKQGVKAYMLLRDALRDSGKVGIAKVVIKTRQHLAAIKPEQNVLVLELMHFAEELVNPRSLQIPGNLQLGPKEVEMAGQLVERMTDKWKPEKYTDDYRHALMELIEKKIESGGRTPAGETKLKQAPTKVIDLVSVLKESLQQAKKAEPPAHRATRKPKKLYKKAA